MKDGRIHAGRILSAPWTARGRSNEPSVRLTDSRFRICPVSIPRPDQKGSDYLDDLRVRDRSERLLAEAIAELPAALDLLASAHCPNDRCQGHGSAKKSGAPACEWCSRLDRLVGLDLVLEFRRSSHG